MKNRTLAVTLGTAVITTAIALLANPVSAGTLTNPPPDNDWVKDTNYSVETDTDLLEKFVLQINGSDLVLNKKGGFKYVGEHWDANFYLNYDAAIPLSKDKIVLSAANLTHKKAHTGDGIGTKTDFDNITIEASSNSNEKRESSSKKGPFPHGPHEDFDFQATVSCTSDNTGGDCQNWFVRIEGQHRTRTTPEPSTILSLLALGTLGAASTLKRKLKPSQLTEKETTKVS
ncbi:hypothetical protein myaer102_12840 [Microcystis viridis NIES-102]|uniref:Ice-binding protein C-terminal domain-containing protein n=1 Tax=Microcystis viridis NIES-102 TaxID=213615 RepID=A0A3G9JSU2_MICVR|nr:PEP-CTERM sorting domain-containing protein [Microcystis viridis]BBH38777.1 hypothetical protein myaer102_12840 [Microcystis viridis NIES-102]